MRQILKNLIILPIFAVKLYILKNMHGRYRGLKFLFCRRCFLHDKKMLFEGDINNKKLPFFHQIMLFSTTWRHFLS